MWADKVGLTRQGWLNRCVNIFMAATNRANIHSRIGGLFNVISVVAMTETVQFDGTIVVKFPGD
jgi:hypothetical protein